MLRVRVYWTSSGVCYGIVVEVRYICVLVGGGMGLITVLQSVGRSCNSYCTVMIIKNFILTLYMGLEMSVSVA